MPKLFEVSFVAHFNSVVAIFSDAHIPDLIFKPFKAQNQVILRA